MSLSLLLFVVFAFILGLIISWILSKSQYNSKLMELQTRLDNNEQLKFQAQTEQSNLKLQLQKLQDEFNDSQQKNAGLTKEVQLLNSTINDNKEILNRKDNQLIEVQTELKKALQEKTTAETTLIDTRKHVGELLKKEYNLSVEIKDLQKALGIIKEENAGLHATQLETNKRLDEQQKFVEEAQKHLKDAFGSLSADALQNNNTSFVELAKAKLEEKVTEAKGEFEKKQQAIGELVKPLGESLKNMDTKIHDLENKRIKAYSDIWNYLDQVKDSTEGLKKETNNLVGALKTSHNRGRYGEIALRRLVEHAGMFENCHFEEQITVEDENGKLRPDMIIKLPGNKTLVVDSKAPLSSYMKIFETEDLNQQKTFLSQHVSAVKDHLKKLSAKSYWSQFKEAPDFVIMYMHIESSYGAALQAWPDMIEEAMKNRIIVATPTVLLSILLGVGYSWNQLKTMENIEEIRDAAVELHDRSAILVDHMVQIGKGLNGTISNYNKAIGSLEGNFLPQARKIKRLSLAYSTKEMAEIMPVETSVRQIVVIPTDVKELE